MRKGLASSQRGPWEWAFPDCPAEHTCSQHCRCHLHSSCNHMYVDTSQQGMRGAWGGGGDRMPSGTRADRQLGMMWFGCLYHLDSCSTGTANAPLQHVVSQASSTLNPIAEFDVSGKLRCTFRNALLTFITAMQSSLLKSASS